MRMKASALAACLLLGSSCWAAGDGGPQAGEKRPDVPKRTVIGASARYGGFVDTYRVRNILREALRTLKDTTSDYIGRRVRGMLKEALYLLRAPDGYGGFYYAEFIPRTDPARSVSREFRQDVWAGSGKWQHDELSADLVYKIEFYVPKKWGFFHGNDPIKLHKVRVSYYVDGRRKRFERIIDRVLDKKDRYSVELPEIGGSAVIEIWSGSRDKDDRKSCALDVTACHPVIRDSYSNPYYDEVRLVKEALEEISGSDMVSSYERERTYKLVYEAYRRLGGSDFDDDPYYPGGLTASQKRAIKYAIFLIEERDYEEAIYELKRINRHVEDYTIKRELEEAISLLENTDYDMLAADRAERILRDLLARSKD